MSNEAQVNELPNSNGFYSLNFNNYVMPDNTPKVGTKFVLNGKDNSFFKYIKQRYTGSTTNAGIIDGYVNYILGAGLKDKKGFNINRYISKEDVRKMCHDYKLYGQFSVQVIWSQGSEILSEKPQPIRFKYMNTEKLGLNVYDSGHYIGEVNGYWYSYDWSNKTKYTPQLYSKFDGIYNKETPVQVITFNRITSEPYFPHPDYVSGLQYAHLEEELSNKNFNYVKNGFSLGTIIVIKGGKPATAELEKKYAEELLSKLTGTENTNATAVHFSGNIEGSPIEVVRMQLDTLDTKNQNDLAKSQIISAHGVPNSILFNGDGTGGGIGNKDEQIEATKQLFRAKINPYREVILDSLNYLFSFAEPNIDLEFEDIDELIVEDKNDEVK